MVGYRVKDATDGDNVLVPQAYSGYLVDFNAFTSGLIESQVAKLAQLTNEVTFREDEIILATVGKH